VGQYQRNEHDTRILQNNDNNQKDMDKVVGGGTGGAEQKTGSLTGFSRKEWLADLSKSEEQSHVPSPEREWAWERHFAQLHLQRGRVTSPNRDSTGAQSVMLDT
jgi:hypothetical protein